MCQLPSETGCTPPLYPGPGLPTHLGFSPLLCYLRLLWSQLIFVYFVKYVFMDFSFFKERGREGGREIERLMRENH